MLGWLFTGLFAFLIFLIPGVDFTGRILGGTVTNLNTGITQIISASGFAGASAAPLVYLGLTGGSLLLFDMYPLSWVLTWRPWDALTIFYMIIPWILSGLIVSRIVAESPRHMLKIGLFLMLANSLWAVGLLIVLPIALLNLPVLGGVGGIIVSALNGVASGFTDMPMGVSAILTQVEGCLLFIGAGLPIAIWKQDRDK
jgi:hypothetical protein